MVKERMYRRKSSPRSAKLGKARPRKPGFNRPRQRGAPAASAAALWLYGRHAVEAALRNPNRRVKRLLCAGPLPDGFVVADPGLVQTVERVELEDLLPPGAVHQGLALETASLDWPALETFCDGLRTVPRVTVVVLDQVTDPQNIGAVLRSSAAFGARAVVVQDRHAPEETGAMAKAASGALETVPLLRAANLSRALGVLQAADFWCVGMAGEAETELTAVPKNGRTAIVLGAEGAGLRRLVRVKCDALAKIPVNQEMESLNLSNACAVALYEMVRGSG